MSAAASMAVLAGLLLPARVIALPPIHPPPCTHSAQGLALYDEMPGGVHCALPAGMQVSCDTHWAAEASQAAGQRFLFFWLLPVHL